ncbi:family 78 glycoside hydrolase catalytic domain [Actinoallomurus sp. CA-142502]|uniref:family 78 glycoside hydrolase catalytic domain n=1 Tax=Actinoallomurus sp. CA-142502 TaxID=3239885 RepID=UPI003D928984
MGRLAPVLAAAVLVVAAAPAAHADTGLRVSDLETEHATNPIAVAAAKPRLGWLLGSAERGQRQTAYRIEVRAGGHRVWDSGKVAGARSYDVSYGGPALSPATRYTWRVRVADAHGRWSPWSGTAWFETAFTGWHASWIGAPAQDSTAPDLTGTNWIWYPEGDPATSAPAGTRYFRRTFDLTSVPAGSRLVMTGDDGFTAWVNGTEVGGREPDPNLENWRHPIVVDVTDQLRTGTNTIAVADTNGKVSAAGLLGRLELGEQRIDTDGSWKVTDKEPSGDWKAAGFDDSAWPAAKVLTAWGGAPWGKVYADAPTLPEPLLRKDFTAGPKKIARARLYAAAGGYEELSLNGRKVGDEVLEPGFTRYDKRVEFVTHDVTAMLRSGANTIGARLGRGFYGMTQQNTWNWHQAPWHGEPRLLAQLVLTYTDGSTQTVASDGTWQYAEGPVRFDSLYGGENYDARADRPGWNTPGYDATTWRPAATLPAPAGAVVPEEHEPIRVTDTIRPVSVTSPKQGTYVVKLPANIAGWARIRVHGPAGTTVSMKYGEKLNADGTVNSVNGFVTGQFQTDQYTLSGRGTETWEPRYSYQGFQYIEVTGWPGTLTADDIDGREVHSDVRSVGSFDSSNALFDRLHQMTRQTVLNNWYGIPTDTPMYEKNGWTGDAQLMAATDTDEFDLRRLYEKWLTDIRDSQGSNGIVPGIAPDNGWGLGYYGQAPPWHAAFTMIPWLMYERYGDRDTLSANYPAMRRYLDGWLATSTSGVYGSSLNDYLAPGYGGNSPEDPKLAGTAYTYANTLAVANAAEALGHPDDAARYRAAAAKIQTAFNDTFLRGDAYVTGSDPDYRQTNALLPLAFGMVPTASVKAVTDRLVKDITDRGDHLNTGALGTRFILDELTKRGQGELAYQVANQQTYPGWGYWVNNGATTLWERWDLDARSHDHVFLGGAVDDWFFTSLAGISPAAPGYDRIAIAPQPLGDLTYVDAATRTPHGRVAVHWKRAGGVLTLSVEVPVGATAEVTVPGTGPVGLPPGARPLDGRRYEVGSGSYEFQVRSVR